MAERPSECKPVYRAFIKPSSTCGGGSGFGVFRRPTHIANATKRRIFSLFLNHSDGRRDPCAGTRGAPSAQEISS